MRVFSSIASGPTLALRKFAIGLEIFVLTFEREREITTRVFDSFLLSGLYYLFLFSFFVFWVLFKENLIDWSVKNFPPFYFT